MKAKAIFYSLIAAGYLTILALLWQGWNTQHDHLMTIYYETHPIPCTTDTECMELNPHLGDY